MTSTTDGFAPPPYPYDRLDQLRAIAAEHPLGCLDLSIGTPVDPAPEVVTSVLADATALPGYPPSIGTPELRAAASDWLKRVAGAVVGVDQVAACIGTKEFVVGLPRWLSLRDPSRDTVLYPAVSYPSYAMGATLAGCRAVAVPMTADWSLDVGQIDSGDAARALCLWVNTPGNPAGGLDDLDAAVAWGRDNDVLVVSDECYIEFTWSGPPRTVLTSGTEGLLAVHSLSKRSNLAGGRLGFYAGDAGLVEYLREVRKHAGFMVPGPLQAAGVAAFGDDAHVEVQRDRYRSRLSNLASGLRSAGVPVEMPRGGFYLWVASPDGDGWDFAQQLASDSGIVASPGEFYGVAGAGHVRLAVVAPDEEFAVIGDRLAAG